MSALHNRTKTEHNVESIAIQSELSNKAYVSIAWLLKNINTLKCDTLTCEKTIATKIHWLLKLSGLQNCNSYRRIFALELQYTLQDEVFSGILNVLKIYLSREDSHFYKW